MIELHITGGSAVTDGARRIRFFAERGMPQAIQSAIVQSTDLVQSTVARLTPVRRGALIGSIYKHVEPLRGVVASRLEKAPYGPIVEKGAKPHTITPKKGKYLVFKGAGGTPVFARRVEHPGFKGRGMFAKTVQQTQKAIRQLFVKAIYGASATLRR